MRGRCFGEADVIIVPNPSSPGQRVLAVAVLKGAMIATPQALLNMAGPAVFYAAAGGTRRRVWLSAQFRRDHPALLAIIQTLTAKTWRLLASPEELRAAQRNPKTGAAVLGAVGATELEACAPPPHPPLP